MGSNEIKKITFHAVIEAITINHNIIHDFMEMYTASNNKKILAKLALM